MPLLIQRSQRSQTLAHTGAVRGAAAADLFQIIDDIDAEARHRPWLSSASKTARKCRTQTGTVERLPVKLERG